MIMSKARKSKTSAIEFEKGFEKSFTALKEFCAKLQNEEKIDPLGLHAGLALAFEYSRAILEDGGYQKDVIDAAENTPREAYRRLRGAGDPSPKANVFSETQAELSKTRYIS